MPSCGATHNVELPNSCFTLYFTWCLWMLSFDRRQQYLIPSDWIYLELYLVRPNQTLPILNAPISWNFRRNRRALIFLVDKVGFFFQIGDTTPTRRNGLRDIHSLIALFNTSVAFLWCHWTICPHFPLRWTCIFFWQYDEEVPPANIYCSQWRNCG